MHWSGEVSLGSLLTIATLVSIAVRIGWMVGGIQVTVRAHTGRLDKYEDTLIKVVGEVQRLVGRIEGVQDRLERRAPPRETEH